MWVIPRLICNQILGHALRTSPEECVGLLSGHGRRMEACHPLTNALHHTQQFLADPSQQIQLMKQLRNQGTQIIAIYHSHPTGPAFPSTLDLQQSHYPEALYLIVSLDTKGRLDMNGYLIQSGQAVLQELSIADQDPMINK